APPSTSDGAPLPGEEVLLDGNVEAGDSPYFALGTFDVSPDGTLLAYSVDFAGDEPFTLRFQDLRTGPVLPAEVPNVFDGSPWSAATSTVFYLTVDEAWRPHRGWRHRLGGSMDGGEGNALVYEETDERFWVGVGLSRSDRYVIIDSHSKVTSE